MRIPRARTWRPLDVSILLTMIGACIWAFRFPFADIATLALRDEEHSHVLLAPVVILWLIWLRRSRLKLIGVRPNLLGTAIVAIGCIIAWFGFRTDTYIAWHGGGIVALLGVLVTMTGLEPLRQFGPAAFAMLFLIPIPGTIRQLIALPLQSTTASVTHSCMEAFGFHVSQLGNLLIVNGEQIAVAEACNGMRLVFSLTLVVYAFVFSVPLRMGTRLLLLAITPLLALVANIARLVPTSLLYGMVEPDKAELFHDLSGWAMLPIALVALIGLLRMLKWLEIPVSVFRLARQ